MNDALILIFIFAFGACVGSFLNVVVYRLPRGQSLIFPPSRCPKCGHRLAWHDNIPVLGWLWLGGKCRNCRAPISPRYPLVEALTGGLFVLYYICLFDLRMGFCVDEGRAWSAGEVWPVYALYMFMLGTLLAASLIDADWFVIPSMMCWLMAGVGLVTHTLIGQPGAPGRLNIGPEAGAVSAGALVGWLISLLLLRLNVLKLSFPQGDPLQDEDRASAEAEWADARARGENPPPLPPVYSGAELRRELRKEMMFLLPPMICSAGWLVAVLSFTRVAELWTPLASSPHVSGMLGSILGAMTGAFVVWITRILGTLAFGRLAMGLGDVHLMFGVGAVIGAAPVTVAFFIAPFFGMILAVYLLVFGKRREIPYGPYLSLGAAATILFYCRIEQWLAPGLTGLGMAIRGLVTGPP